MNNSSIFIVIPIHNRLELTRNCLLSLRRQSYQNSRIIVVDDGSTDGSAEVVFSEFPEVVLLHGDGNLWWTGATNLGVELALRQGAERIMTLNNDTVAPADFLEKMLYWGDREPRALLGAFAIDINTNKPVYGGERIDWRNVTSTFLLDVLDEERRSGLQEVTHFPGRGLVIPSSTFHEIGLFDAKNFPHYAADYDFTHRAVRAGYKIFCNFDARLYVYPEASGDVSLRRKKNLGNYYHHLFGIKGGGNLRIFTSYVLKNCPPQYRTWFLFRGYAQRILGYWADALKEPRRRILGLE